MAAFYNEAPPTNDPNYGGASKGFSDVRPNTAIGDALKGLGGMVDAGAKGLYSAVNDTLKDQIRAAVEPIRDAHGGNITPEEAPAIAGTGARGAKYSVATTNDDIAAEPALPEAIQAGLSRLQRMQAAYRGGGLSDTKYSAELEAQVQKFRSQYPAWKDEIDQHVSQITGQTPANALRASVLRDMISMQAASNNTQKKYEAFVNTHQDDIALAFPDKSYTWMVQHAPELMNDPHVMALKYEKAVSERASNQFTTLDKTSASKGLLAEQFVRQEGNRIVAGALTGALNSSALNIPNIIANGIKDDATLKSSLPQLQQLKLQLQTSIQKVGNNYDPSNPKSEPPSKYLKEGQLSKIAEDATANVQNIIDLITKGKADQAMLFANTGKISKETTMQALRSKFPLLGTVEAMAEFDRSGNLSGIFTKDMANDQAFMQQIKMGTWLNSVAKRPGTITDTVNMMPTHQMAPKDFYGLVKSQLDIIRLHPDPGSKAGAVATLFDNMDHYSNLKSPQAKMQLFRQTTAPDVSKTIFTLDPEAQRQYSGAVQKMFNSTFAQGAADLDQVLRSQDYIVKQDPKTLQFTVIPTDPKFRGQSADEFNKTTGERRPQGRLPGQRLVDDINYGISALLPVLQHNSPGQELKALSQILTGLGVQFNAPKDKGFGARVGQAVVNALSAGGEAEKRQAEDLMRMYEQDWKPSGELPSAYPSSQFNDELGAPNLTAWLAAHGNTKKPAGTPKPVNVSDWGDITNVQVDNIPKGMTAHKFLQLLKERQNGR